MALTKTNIPGYYKDSSTGVIINKNMSEYETMKAQRQKSKQNNELIKDVDQLKNDMNDIKLLLQKLVNSK